MLVYYVAPAALAEVLRSKRPRAKRWALTVETFISFIADSIIVAVAIAMMKNEVCHCMKRSMFLGGARKTSERLWPCQVKEWRHTVHAALVQ